MSMSTVFSTGAPRLLPGGIGDGLQPSSQLAQRLTEDRQSCYLNQFLLRPDLDGLNLLGGLGLNAVGVQKDLQSRQRERRKSKYCKPACSFVLESLKCCLKLQPMRRKKKRSLLNPVLIC